jgi:hypothetical protein
MQVVSRGAVYFALGFGADLVLARKPYGSLPAPERGWPN